jgi:hypothetical protein
MTLIACAFSLAVLADLRLLATAAECLCMLMGVVGVERSVAGEEKFDMAGAGAGLTPGSE